MLRGQVTLTTDTLLTVIRGRHAEPHPVLADTPVWCDDDARHALAERARDELGQHDLISGERLAPDFEDVLGAIIHPERELYGWVDATIDDQPRRYGILAGAAHLEGFVLVREYETNMLVLVSIGPAGLLDGFVAQLPPVRPALAPPITVPYEDFLAVIERKPHEGFSGFRKPGYRDARALQTIFGQQRTGGGNLYAAARSRNGTRVRIEHPVNYIDTSNGRWLAVLDTSNGQRWATATPASPQLIAGRLNQHAAALPGYRNC